jgi:hypothetical protein
LSIAVALGKATIIVAKTSLAVSVSCKGIENMEEERAWKEPSAMPCVKGPNVVAVETSNHMLTLSASSLDLLDG